MWSTITSDKVSFPTPMHKKRLPESWKALFSFKDQRQELVEAAAPGLPFVGGVRGDVGGGVEAQVFEFSYVLLDAVRVFL